MRGVASGTGAQPRPCKAPCAINEGAVAKQGPPRSMAARPDMAGTLATIWRCTPRAANQSSTSSVRRGSYKTVTCSAAR